MEIKVLDSPLVSLPLSESETKLEQTVVLDQLLLLLLLLLPLLQHGFCSTCHR